MDYKDAVSQQQDIGQLPTEIAVGIHELFKNDTAAVIIWNEIQK